MDLSTIGSISQYARGVALKTQWNLKKKSGDVTAHGKGLNDFLSVGGPAAKTPEEADNEKLQKITNKVSVGAKLTEKEMEYLREKNPQLYEKLRQIEREQKDYEEALRHCKTKDEAQRLHMARLGEAMQAAKNGDGTAAYRMNRMTESMTAFAETGEYKKLSTESEQASERREQRDAEQAAREPELSAAGAPERAETAADDAPDENAKAEGPVKAESPAKAEPAERERPAPAAAPRFEARAYVAAQGSEAREKRRKEAFEREA